MTTTTKTTGISWAVMRDGRLASLHRLHDRAVMAAKDSGLVLSVETDTPEMAVGDWVESYHGEIRPIVTAAEVAGR